MKIETITCDSCGKMLKPKNYLYLEVTCKAWGGIKSADNILMNDICEDCVKEIYLAINNAIHRRTETQRRD